MPKSSWAVKCLTVLFDLSALYQSYHLYPGVSLRLLKHIGDMEPYRIPRYKEFVGNLLICLVLRQKTEDLRLPARKIVFTLEPAEDLVLV